MGIDTLMSLGLAASAALLYGALLRAAMRLAIGVATGIKVTLPKP